MELDSLFQKIKMAKQNNYTNATNTGGLVQLKQTLAKDLI